MHTPKKKLATPLLLMLAAVLFSTRVWGEEKSLPSSDDAQEGKESADDPATSEDDELGIEIEYADDAISNENVSAPNTQSESQSDQPGVVNFSGRLLEKGSRTPLANVTLYLKELQQEAVTDSEGYFEFVDVPAGKHTVIVPTTSHEKVETTETIAESKRTDVKYYMTPKVYDGLEVVVRDKKIEKEVSHQELTIEQASKVAGTGGDAVRAIETMPGIARGAFSGGNQQPVMRGSNAETSKVYLDGHEIPMVFHFGELKSAYNSNLLKQFDLYNGGFSAEHRMATGGVVDMKTRAPRSDRWGGVLDASTIDVSALAEGPITDDLSMAVSARHSTMEYIFEAIDLNEKIDEWTFTRYPSYWDYQAKLNYRLNGHNTLTLDGFGFHDGLAFDQDTVAEDEPDLTGSAEMAVDFHTVYANWNFENKFFESRFSPAYSYGNQEMNYGPYFFNMKWHVADLREDMKFHLGKHNTLAVGGTFSPGTLNMSANMVRPPKEGDVSFTLSNNDSVTVNRDFSFYTAGGYVEDQLQLGPVLLVPGVRFDYESSMGISSVDPRGAVRWQVLKPLVLKASGGIYSRLPDGDEYLEPWGNDLQFEKAVHAVGGFEWQMVEGLDVDVQGYYKYLYDQVVRVQDSESDDLYENAGKGYVVGGDAMIRYNWNERLTGWLSYSVSKSMRNDGIGTPYRPFDKDQRHNLVIVSSYDFGHGWSVGAKFQFTSGEPHTPTRNSIFNADNGTYLLVYDDDKNNSLNVEPYHRLDIRIDKKWLMNNWALTAYLEVQNVYNRQNPVDVKKNYDFSETKNQTDTPILPSIGVTAQF